MKTVDNLAQEFEGLMAHYAANPQSQDVVDLAIQYADENEAYEYEPEDFQETWQRFLYEHKNQINVQMAGLVTYLLKTYWVRGEEFYRALPQLEKILLWEMVQEMSAEIERRSAFSGNTVAGVGD